MLTRARPQTLADLIKLPGIAHAGNTRARPQDRRLVRIVARAALANTPRPGRDARRRGVAVVEGGAGGAGARPRAETTNRNALAMPCVMRARVAAPASTSGARAHAGGRATRARAPASRVRPESGAKVRRVRSRPARAGPRHPAPTPRAVPARVSPAVRTRRAIFSFENVEADPLYCPARCSLPHRRRAMGSAPFPARPRSPRAR